MLSVDNRKTQGRNRMVEKVERTAEATMDKYAFLMEAQVQQYLIEWASRTGDDNVTDLMRRRRNMRP